MTISDISNGDDLSMSDLNLSLTFKEKKSRRCQIYKAGAFTILLLLGVTFFNNCENPITGYGPQPRYIEDHNFKPMLNILGILRPDTLLGLPQSFVHLEESYPFNKSPDSTIITDAQVTLYKYEGTAIVDSMRLTYSNYQSHFQTKEYRDSTFFPEAGITYGISCRREGFPNLRGFARVPQVPMIDVNSLRISSGQLSLTIKRDSQVALYDIYFLVEEKEYQIRIHRPETGDVQVVLELDQAPTGNGELLVYGYDLSLSEYISYNISIKPNTYRAPYSTIENGYGCFGSLNIFKKTVSF
jgi:hypothetical protein